MRAEIVQARPNFISLCAVAAFALEALISVICGHYLVYTLFMSFQVVLGTETLLSSCAITFFTDEYFVMALPMFPKQGKG